MYSNILPQFNDTSHPPPCVLFVMQPLFRKRFGGFFISDK
ncbi:hypothetical protein VP501E541_P0281 [Vibrio phage 501E54-1]|nr:hypothetical protein VP501E541_P0281 [Vibrio phage 501E54-1]